MKTLILVTILFFAAVNFTSAQLTIYSTTTGGNWNDVTTWIGGVLPGSGNDVVIDGQVAVLNYDNKCRNIIINQNKYLGGTTGFYGQLTVFGNITNSGLVGGGASFDIYGNITNNGTWGNDQFRIRLWGTNQTITCTESSPIGAQLVVMDSTTNVFLGSSLHLIVNGDYNCNFGNSELFTQGHNLKIDNGQLTNARVTTNDTLTFNNTILSSVVINGNYYLKGNLTAFEGNVLKGSIKNLGNIINLPGYSTVLTIEGDIINYGSLQHSDVYLKNNATNYGTWFNQMTRFTGPNEKILINSPGHPFDGVQMRIEDTAAVVKLGSDVEISADHFFLEKGKINCNGNMLRTNTVYHNGKINSSNKINQHAYYENITIEGAAELYGINNMMFSTINGNVTNHDTISTPYIQSGNSLNVYGHFINKGIYHTLYMDLFGDLTNHGSIYDNSLIDVKGTSAQSINISQQINSMVRFHPLLTGTTYQWMKNGADMTGEQNELLIFNTMELNNDGVYKCRVVTGSNTQYSREITVNRVTGIEQENDLSLNDFTLYQNYPNPFNPATKIRYTVPDIKSRGTEGARVQIKVYDLLGKEVLTIVDEFKPEGSYEVDFGGNLINKITSGVYFYQLRAGNFVQTKKMTLIK